MKLNDVFEIEKKAGTLSGLIANPATSAFLSGAKQSIPWSLGFYALNRAMVDDYKSSKTKTRELIRDVASGAAGWGTWNAVEELMKGVVPQVSPEVAKLPFLKRLTKLPYLAKKILPFGAGLLLSGLASDVVGKLFENRYTDPDTAKGRMVMDPVWYAQRLAKY